ncbi:hypothetical protein BJ956_000850 [Arthrobacter psychrochitiniphilus]|uniref:Uncharacterized protein n=1 Tax=Arthrobacter psychrochitiniphilus TaxID=291045 RepID=A0A2V3E2Q4_9MICC|nr:hypothetical protein [Arthrobacter psychrochitiniphilus]PXA69504.1 hypothetical protein CVS29_02885 [Arthrobacter psychrochitiniphilus]
MATELLEACSWATPNQAQHGCHGDQDGQHKDCGAVPNAVGPTCLARCLGSSGLRISHSTIPAIRAQAGMTTSKGKAFVVVLGVLGCLEFTDKLIPF